MKLLTLFLVLALALTAQCWTYEGHEMQGEASKLVYEGIKKTLLGNIDKFANQDTALKLKADLEEPDAKKRTLEALDTATANQVFSLFGLQDPGCDKSGNGLIEGDELKCLNKIWKYFVPS